MLQARLFRFPAAPKDVAPTLSKRRGAGRDRYGNWYWIGETEREIRVQSSGSGATSHFWSVGDGASCEPSTGFGEFQPREPETPPPPLQLRGLAVTEDHYLVVGVVDPAGLLIFDLHAGGAPRQLLWPSGVDFTPFDMAPRPGGGVWILDRDHRSYWGLDRHFHVINPFQEGPLPGEPQHEVFQPVDQSSERVTPRLMFPSSLPLYTASPLPANDPVAIEALPDGTVLILDNGQFAPHFSAISRYRFAQQLGQSVSTNAVLTIIEEEQRAGFHLVGHDFAFVPEHIEAGEKIPDRLYVVAADGNQAFAFNLGLDGEQLTIQPLAAFFPMRLFGGKALVAAEARAYYDYNERWIPLVEQRRPRYVEQAILTTPYFDGAEPDCVWHRLMLDACIPPETQVEVWSRAANTVDEIADAPWRAEPSLYLRGNGSELPYLQSPMPVTATATTASTMRDGTWELLFQRARGRYLQLQLRITGNERTTPRLRALRVYYPRFSYLTHYLPSVYREDEGSASFLDRFLANLEGLSTALEDKIAAVQVLFDAQSAPAEVLAWLVSWFGVALDPAWDEPRRRLFIGHAMEFFQYRGTIPGLLMALRLVLEPCPNERIFTSPYTPGSRSGAVRIVERYRTRRTPGVVLGDPTEQTGLREVTLTTRWQPSQGSESLHQRYDKFLHPTDDPSHTPVRFPITQPTNDSEAALWRQFGGDVLGFTPSATDSDLPRWRNFLARRYQHIGALNAVYRTAWTTFDIVPRPTQLPGDGAPLQDWYQFEGVVLAMHRTAHRFTVLVPTPPSETINLDEHVRQLELVQRVITLEKPAHTTFAVKFYWAAFRVGEARLGDDTIIDLGARAPQFLRALVLGQGYVSENYLAPGHPYDVVERSVVGRERLGQSPTL
jgi:phage tail-like protein